MKKISLAILTLIVVLASCKKTPDVNLKYVDVVRDLVTVGTTAANIQCDYDYIATLKKAYLFYGEGEEEFEMTSAEMRVVQNTLYVELTGLKENTTYSYYYEFHNGFNSMRSASKTFKTETSTASLATVITAEVIEITTNSAKGGGEITNDGGAEVTERGICWSTTANPTISDRHVAVGTGMGVFAATMSGLETNTTYHVRAYAINDKGTAYGLDREFTTLDGGGTGDHEYVDLGLPSGTLWATCNVGASTPEGYGDYFAWGETQPKENYEWDTYKYGGMNTLTKYCNQSNYGYNGFTDNLTILQPDDDAATANWGNGWCMPTKEQWEELLQNTSHTWTTQNNVNGRLFTASNGNSLFLPAAGDRRGNELCDADVYGLYWSGALGNDTANPPYGAWYFGFYLGTPPDDYYISCAFRYTGQSVRPVRSSR